MNTAATIADREVLLGSEIASCMRVRPNEDVLPRNEKTNRFHLKEEVMAKRRSSSGRRSSGRKKYGALASRKVERAMRERKRGTLRSGRSRKRVTSRKQAIAIGLSEARRAGGKVPKRKR